MYSKHVQHIKLEWKIQHGDAQQSHRVLQKSTYSSHSSFHRRAVVHWNTGGDKEYKRAANYQSIHFWGTVPSGAVIMELQSHRNCKGARIIYKRLLSSQFEQKNSQQ